MKLVTLKSLTQGKPAARNVVDILVELLARELGITDALDKMQLTEVVISALAESLYMSRQEAKTMSEKIFRHYIGLNPKLHEALQRHFARFYCELFCAKLLDLIGGIRTERFERIREGDAISIPMVIPASAAGTENDVFVKVSAPTEIFSSFSHQPTIAVTLHKFPLTVYFGLVHKSVDKQTYEVWPIYTHVVQFPHSDAELFKLVEQMRTKLKIKHTGKKERAEQIFSRIPDIILTPIQRAILDSFLWGLLGDARGTSNIITTWVHLKDNILFTLEDETETKVGCEFSTSVEILLPINVPRTRVAAHSSLRVSCVGRLLGEASNVFYTITISGQLPWDMSGLLKDEGRLVDLLVKKEGNIAGVPTIETTEKQLLQIFEKVARVVESASAEFRDKYNIKALVNMARPMRIEGNSFSPLDTGWLKYLIDFHKLLDFIYTKAGYKVSHSQLNRNVDAITVTVESFPPRELKIIYDVPVMFIGNALRLQITLTIDEVSIDLRSASYTARLSGLELTIANNNAVEKFSHPLNYKVSISLKEPGLIAKLLRVFVYHINVTNFLLTVLHNNEQFGELLRQVSRAPAVD